MSSRTSILTAIRCCGLKLEGKSSIQHEMNHEAILIHDPEVASAVIKLGMRFMYNRGYSFH